ncbi:MAG: hypothetical protein LUE89_10710 [Clostridiales bacterium]|nr:hypothetical protein [Clostridiales bacterium]
MIGQIRHISQYLQKVRNFFPGRRDIKALRSAGSPTERFAFPTAQKQGQAAFSGA